MATLNFKGKSAVWNHHLSVPYHTLDKDAKASLKGTDETENLIIEGDNLLALKSLLPKYQGKVKCSYIDPPYNTGNEGWVYSDNVNSPMIREWIGKEVGLDDLTRHDKWLAMMTPRLKILDELLTEDGVIFISIDENELYNLKNLLDEFFLEKNFIANITVQVNKGGRDYLPIAITHQYLLCYTKSELSIINELEDANNSFPLTDKNGGYELRELRNRNPRFNRSNRPNLYYPIYINPASANENGECLVKPEKTKDFSIEVYPLNSRGDDSCWRWGKQKVLSNIASSVEVSNVVGKQRRDGGWNIYEKSRRTAHKAKSIWDESEVRTEQGTIDLRELGLGGVFDHPKPVYLIKKILRLATDKDSIILDSFAGSGTTAQAVLDFNAEDGSNRKFILVQLPEEVKKGTPAYKMGFRQVHEITRERVKRVIAKNKYKTGFTYYTLGSSIDAESILTGKLPTYKEFAKYVYYLATGKNHPDEKKIKEEYSFVGKTDHQSVYLIYEKNVDALKKLAITLDWAQKTDRKDANKKIVYAPACYLDDEALEQFNIKFVSIPYNLFERAT